MTEAGTAMISSYDYRLVALSVLIAIFAAYAALDLAGRTTAARGRVRLAWLIGGAAAMGSGIWSMHYIGMLAFSLPVPVSYDWPTVLVSLLAAIFASAVALFVASRRKMGWLRALIGSTIMGSGIAAMHYIGMAAMRSTAMCYYDPALFTLSVVLAILISLVALWLTFMLREDKKAAGWRKTASALVMGAAIPVMHYTGMAAARFTASTMVPDTSHAVSISALGIAGISAVTLLVLGLAVLTSFVDRRFSVQSLQLEMSEQRYRQLVESAQAILWQRNVKTSQFTFISKEAETLLGYPIDRWLNEPTFWGEHIHPDDRALAELECAKATEENRPQQFEHRMIAANGRVVWLRNSVRVVVSGDHEKELVGVMVDITERKRAEASREQLASIVDYSDEAIIGKTLDGVIINWNKGAERLYGYSAEEVKGKLISILLPSDHSDEFPIIMEKLRRGEPSHQETVRRRKDGRLVDVSLTISPIRDGLGRVVAASAIARDIGERKRFEHTLQEKNIELERANAAKDRFLASMSHELRTPLNAVIGFTGTLLMRLPGPLTDEQAKQLRTIQSSAKHLLSLISDLLDLAKIESSQVTLTAEPIVCQSLVEEVRTTLLPLAEQKGLEFNVTVPEDPLLVNTDRRALTQILLNLANNAIKFTERGKVHIVLCRQSDNGKSWTQLSVHDTGIGIRLEDQAKLFQAFSQVERSGPRRQEGTGLGLHLSQKLAEFLGGQISFKSEYGRGSMFTLSLPES